MCAVEYRIFQFYCAVFFGYDFGYSACRRHPQHGRRAHGSPPRSHASHTRFTLEYICTNKVTPVLLSLGNTHRWVKVLTVVYRVFMGVSVLGSQVLMNYVDQPGHEYAHHYVGLNSIPIGDNFTMTDPLVGYDTDDVLVTIFLTCFFFLGSMWGGIMHQRTNATVTYVLTGGGA